MILSELDQDKPVEVGDVTYRLAAAAAATAADVIDVEPILNVGHFCFRSHFYLEI